MDSPKARITSKGNYMDAPDSSTSQCANMVGRTGYQQRKTISLSALIKVALLGWVNDTE